MDARRFRSAWVLFAASCLVAGFAAGARGDGSARFNGTNSKLENGSANLLSGLNDITVCAWVNASGVGEASNGTVLRLDETSSSSLRLHHTASANTLAWTAAFSPTSGVWSFPVLDGTWNAVAISYNKSDANNNPTVRVNFAQVTPSEVSPGGSPGMLNTGYCVGNDVTTQNATWNGRLAHVQVFNRILSAEEMDACLQAPGSVTNGLRLWLPMTNAADVKDRSPNGFDGAATALVTDISGPMITNQPGALYGVTILSAGFTNVLQHIVPRYNNKVTHPGGQLRGSGPASVIRGTDATDNLPSDKNGVVITEEYDEEIGQHQTTSASKQAVLQAAVRDLTIAGYDDTGAGYTSSGNELVDNEPAKFNRITGAITATTGSGVIVDVTSAGHGLQSFDVVEISGVLGNEAANGSHEITRISDDVFKLNGATGTGAYQGGGVWECNVHWPDKYHGLLMQSSGLLVENVNFFYIPGTALVVRKGTAGALNGPLLPFDREKTRIWDCKVNRAYSGFVIDDVDAVVGRLEGTDLRDFGIKFGTGTGTGSIHIDGALSFHRVGVGGADQPAVWFVANSGGCWGGPINVRDARIGVLIENSANLLGPITAKECVVANIDIRAERNTVGPVELEVAANAKGVSIYTQFNKLLGGSIKMMATSAVGVGVQSGGNSGNGIVIRDVTFIGQSSTQGTAFTTADPLNNCTIEAHFENVGTGIDLYPGSVDKLGSNNTIRITTEGVTNRIKLPPTIGASNNIWINGVKEED